MAGEAEVQVSHFLDEHGVGAFQIKLILWSVLIAFIDGADVVAVDEGDQNRPQDQLDLKCADAVLVEKMRNLNFRLARHRFPQCFRCFSMLLILPRYANYGTRQAKESGHSRGGAMSPPHP